MSSTVTIKDRAPTVPLGLAYFPLLGPSLTNFLTAYRFENTIGGTNNLRRLFPPREDWCIALFRAVPGAYPFRVGVAQGSEGALLEFIANVGVRSVLFFRTCSPHHTEKPILRLRSPHNEEMIYAPRN